MQFPGVIRLSDDDRDRLADASEAIDRLAAAIEKHNELRDVELNGPRG
ncbi:hypothetical protein Jolie2_40 [Mycobacterium phage Jolie2]|uniref:Uncharacterized protein n=1 Tax=Mycobacterium phage Jolie2 TaxID=1458831 RepID=W8EI04_9CAUD|nr:hypothetical protein Jolie2_40 [Mycobacterium phage Jolie2]AHJ86590.1 hypothetical protein Jolie2_40 [Mycobacterium phage Jolie2]